MGPEDELSDQAPETSDGAEVVPAGPSDSGLDFAPEGAGDAPDEYTPDESVPKVDLSGELAEDAGERASYGFEAASEVPAEGGELAPDELTSMASTGADDSDRFRIQEVPGASDSTGFADDAGEQPHDDTYDPPADEAAEDDGVGYASAAQSEADEEAPVEEAPVEEAPVEEAPVEEAPVEEAPVEEEVRAPPRRAEPPKPAPAVASSDDDPRPGQIRKSVLDEIFARAAQIKKKKK